MGDEIAAAVFVDMSAAEVHHGSILGPLLFILFTCDLPEAIHDPEAHPHHSEDSQAQYHLHCQKCGGLCCYADDSTYTKSNTDPAELKKEIDSAFIKISDYMAKNKLVLNGDKTHVMIMSSAKNHKRHGDYGITLNTGSKIIEPSQNEKLLGAFISNDLTWKEHIRDNNKSLFKILTSRINALAKIARISDFKTRKT